MPYLDNDNGKMSYEKELLGLLDQNAHNPNGLAYYDDVISDMSVDDCITGITTFISTLGNRLRPQTITTAQYHPGWIHVLRDVCRHMGPQMGDSVLEALDSVLSVIAYENFPTQILGASEMLILGLIFYETDNFGLFPIHVQQLYERYRHVRTPGWYMFDRWKTNPDVDPCDSLIWYLVNIGRQILGFKTRYAHYTVADTA
jgi:hypothetical protein